MENLRTLKTKIQNGKKFILAFDSWYQFRGLKKWFYHLC